VCIVEIQVTQRTVEILEMDGPLNHEDIAAFLEHAYSEGAWISYQVSSSSFPTYSNAIRTVGAKLVKPKGKDTFSAVVTTTGPKGEVEEHFMIPAPGWIYWTLQAERPSDRVVINWLRRLDSVDTNAAAASGISGGVAGRQKTSSEEQREAIMNQVRESSVAASTERLELLKWMQEFEAKAGAERAAESAKTEKERLQLLQEQREAATAAKNERAAEAAKAEKERRSLYDLIQGLVIAQQNTGAARSSPAPVPPLPAATSDPLLAQTLAALQQQMTAMQKQQQTLAAAMAQGGNARTHQVADSSSSSDDEALATDVDDEDACRKARENWISRTRSTPKQKSHLVAWLSDQVSISDFSAKWGRKLDLGENATARDVADALALESAIVHLHRAIHADATNRRHVAVYAVQAALENLMAMAQKLEMRASGASADALAAFDVELPVVNRKCRRRAVDYQHIEQIAATVTRKHPKKKRDNDKRRGDRNRGGHRGGEQTDTSAPNSRTPSATPAPRK